jgi:mannosyl-oligosaccharide glucosidase
MQLLWPLLAFAPVIFAQSANVSENLLWGAYRPNLYFGLRPQIPQSLMTGLLWYGTDNYQSLTSQYSALHLNTVVYSL